MNEQRRTSPWLSSLYFAKGIPRVVVFVIALLMFRQMGYSLSACLCGLSVFYLPWVLKVWWKPFVDRTMSYRLWIYSMQFALAVAFGLLAFCLSVNWQMWCLLILISWLAAVHNVAVDGFARLQPLASHHSVVQELFRKFSFVVGQGFLLVLAGNMQVFYRYDMRYSWSVLFYLLSGVFLLLLFWHMLMLPRRRAVHIDMPLRFPFSVSSALFLLCCPFAQAMVGKVSILFLVDTFRNGGVGLSPQEFGFVMGIVGIVALTIGGFLGTKMVSRFGFRKSLWPMAFSMLVPCVVYVALSYWQPRSLLIVGLCVLAEQLTYGFGFTAYLSYLKKIVNREMGKSLMALSLLLGCLVSGPLLQLMDYNAFFVLAQGLSVLTLLSAFSVYRVVK